MRTRSTQDIIVTCYFFCYFFGSQLTMAQEMNKESLPYVEYRHKELEVKITIWSGVKLQRRDGTPIELGYFGVGYEDIFKDSYRALSAMSTYRKLRITGTVCRVMGLSSILAEVSLIIAGKLNFSDSLSMAVLVPGAVLGIGGGFFMKGADAYLSDAIQQYNADLLHRLDGMVRQSSIPKNWSIFYKQSF